MAKTAFAAGDALTKKLWEEELFRDAKKESYFGKFMGKGSGSLVQTNTKLKKSKGDNVTFGLRMRLSGQGVTSGQTLEGNEESLVDHDFSISLEEYAHAVRDAGPLDRQRVMYGLDEESKMALKDWGSEKMDSLCFSALLGTPTRVFYRTSAGNLTTATAATAKAALTAADSKIDPSLLDFAKPWIKTGGNRAQPPIRPIKYKGKDYWVFLAHPDVYYDMRQNATWLQAVREAMPRGTKNPIFDGALGVWNGMILHEHEGHADKAASAGLIGTDGGSGSVPWAKCVIMGAQALCVGEGARGKLVAEEFDYGREHGFGWSMMTAVGKPKFNSLDYGSVGVYVARTQISDAS